MQASDDMIPQSEVLRIAYSAFPFLGLISDFEDAFWDYN